MAAPNPFGFTGSKIPHSTSSDTNLRARNARLERENATLKHDLREANDANGVARATTAADKAANDRVHDAQRETQRAQMAEMIARNAMDDLRLRLKTAESAYAELQEMVKLQQEQERETIEAGKLQVEPQTDRDSPANATAAAGDTNDIHATCQRERADLIRQFEELCKDTNRKQKDEKAAFEATYKAESEAANTKAKEYIDTLEEKLKDCNERLEALQKEAEQNAQIAESTEILKDRLQVREAELDRRQLQFEEQVVRVDAEMSKTSEEQHKVLQHVEEDLTSLREEMEGLKAENKGYEEELDEMRNEIAKRQSKLDHQKELERDLIENNDRFLADLQAEQLGRRGVTAERDEFEVQLVKTEEARQELAQTLSDLEEEHALILNEFESAAKGEAEQRDELQKDFERLAAQHANDITAKDRCIDRLERDVEMLKTQNAELTSHNEMLEKFKNVPQTQSVDGLGQKHAHESISQPNNIRSVSMASHTSLADELDFDDDRSDRSSSVDEESLPEHAELEFSRVEYIMNDPPQDLVKPHLTVSIAEAVATTPRIRQDSPFDQSPVSSASVPALPRPARPQLDIFEDTVAEIMPSQPTNPTLSFSGTTVEAISPIDPEPAALAASKITSVNSAPTNMVEDLMPVRPAQPRAASTSRRRGPLDLYPKSSGRLHSRELEALTTGQLAEDDLVIEPPNSSATQTTSPSSDSPTIVGALPSPVTKGPYVIFSTQAGRSDASAHAMVLLLLLVLGVCSKSLLPVLLILLAIVSTSLQLYSALYTPASVTPKKGINPTVHYALHALLLPLTFFCWRYWSQVQAWEQVNGVGFGEDFGGTYDDLGPYGNGHYLLSKLPLNWVSADSQLPARAVYVLTSTVSAFEGLIGLGPTPAF